MKEYFIRRILLIPVTFVAITFLVYAVLRIVPGGPIEQASQMMRQQAAQGGGGVAGQIPGGGELLLPEGALKQLREYYKLDSSIPVGYIRWLIGYHDYERGKDEDFNLLTSYYLAIFGDGPRVGEKQRWHHGIITGGFGKSYIWNDPVLEVIFSKFSVSIYFGLIGFFGSWLVCVPLGVIKALQHRRILDSATSIFVFAGYAIPGFVACLVLLVVFGGGSYLDWVPLGGFRPDNWNELAFFQKVVAQLHHTIVPVIGYMIGSFAIMTVLMKNSLMENLGADYIRTAYAKGLSEVRVLFLHAMRNSLIPLTAGLGDILGLLFAGSFFIERACNIDGMGLLGLNALLQRDYPVILGLTVFLVLIQLTGNIFSDLIWAAIDPRIRFNK